MRETTIKIDEEVWKKLNDEKKLGETLNDVLHRLLEITKKGEA